MVVMKFGGSSISTPTLINNVAQIIVQRRELKPVIVVSAVGKTTSKLQTIAQNEADGNSLESRKLLDQLEQMHADLMREVGADNLDCLKRQDRYLSELRITLQLISNRKKLSGLLKDKVLSFGELLSTNLIFAVLNSYGLNPKLLDARICMITDEHFTHAQLIENESAGKIREYIIPVLEADYLPVIQGYIGSSKSGAATTLGFEGSDYSSVFIGTALNAENVQIWKDVPGVMTADPKILSNAGIIKKMSYDEAEELALCGAKILHPKSIGPARKSDIKISIFNTRKPDSSPTLIDKNSGIDNQLPKSVTSRNNLCVVKIQSNSTLNDFAFYKYVFDKINSFEFSPFYIQGRYEFIFLILKDDPQIADFEKELKPVSNVVIEKDVASISLIGQNIARDKNIEENISGMFEEHILRYSLTENRKHSLTFIIDKKYLDRYYREIHSRFVLGSGSEKK